MNEIQVYVQCLPCLLSGRCWRLLRNPFLYYMLKCACCFAVFFFFLTVVTEGFHAFSMVDGESRMASTLYEMETGKA